MAAAALVAGFPLLAAVAPPSVVTSGLRAQLLLLPLRARIVAKLGVEGAPKSFARRMFVARAGEAEDDDDDDDEHVMDDEHHPPDVEELVGINGNDQHDFKKANLVIEGGAIEGVNHHNIHLGKKIISGAALRQRRAKISDAIWRAPLLPGFRKWKVICQENGRPIRRYDNVHEKLDIFLSSVALTHWLCPLTYRTWSLLMKEREALLFDVIEKRFVLPSAAARKWCSNKMNEKWVKFRYRLKKKYFVPNDREASIRNFDDDRVPMACWESLVNYWMNEGPKIESSIKSGTRQVPLIEDVTHKLMMRRHQKGLPAQSDISGPGTQNIHEQQFPESTTSDV